MQLRADIEEGRDAVALFMAFVDRAVVNAQNRTILRTADKVVTRLRKAVKRRFPKPTVFGQDFSKAIRFHFFGTRRSGGKPPEAEIFSKAVVSRGGARIDLFRIFETSARVRARGGEFLVVPADPKARNVPAKTLLAGARLIPFYRARRGGGA